MRSREISGMLAVSMALISLALVSCLEGVADFGEVAEGTDLYNDIPFSGIDSISGVTDTTATINWTHAPAASGYQIFNTTSGTPSLVSVVLAPTTSYSLTGLTPGATYKFRVNALDSEGMIDANTKDVSVTTNLAPDAPSGLSLVSPASSPGFDNTPTIQVSGVKSGDIIKVFTDSSCTTEVGSGTASGSTINITTSTLTSGSYVFYANATNAQTSTCSTASVSYDLSTCPDNYIPVPGNATLGTTEFCVMKYEAKAWEDANTDDVVDVSELHTIGCLESGCTTANWASIPTYRPVSHEDGKPWRRISQVYARIACDSLNEPGETKFALISNPEWMTIARNIEAQDANWSGGSVGNGVLWQGNTGTNSVGGYNGVDPESGSGRNTKARHVLSNGEEIWDLSGNVWEWVDWNVTPANKAYYSADGGPVADLREFNVLDTLMDLTDEMFPDSWRPGNPSYTTAQGMGYYYAGNNTTGGAACRGGAWHLDEDVGIYALVISIEPTHTVLDLGFRCVYRP